VQVEAKFSTILPDTASPVIRLDVPKFLGSSPVKIPVQIEEQNPAGWTYTLDAGEPERIGYALTDISGNAFEIDLATADLSEGTHTLRVDSSDAVGHSSSAMSVFEVDRSPPSIDLYIEQENSTRRQAGDVIILSEDALLSWDVSDRNGVTQPISVSVPGADKMTVTESSAPINVTSLEDGRYNFTVYAQDAAGNSGTRAVQVMIDKTQPLVSFAAPTSFELRGAAKLTLEATDQNLKQVLLKIGDRRTVDVTGTSEFVLDTSELPDGQHTLTLLATDLAGNEGVATTNISVSNLAPQLTFSAILGLIAGGAIASGAWLAILRGKRRQPSNQ
jgi:hypothetical protein